MDVTETLGSLWQMFDSVSPSNILRQSSFIHSFIHPNTFECLLCARQCLCNLMVVSNYVAVLQMVNNTFISTVKMSSRIL